MKHYSTDHESFFELYVTMDRQDYDPDLMAEVIHCALPHGPRFAKVLTAVILESAAPEGVGAKARAADSLGISRAALSKSTALQDVGRIVREYVQGDSRVNYVERTDEEAKQIMARKARALRVNYENSIRALLKSRYGTTESHYKY